MAADESEDVELGLDALFGEGEMSRLENEDENC